ncbi:MAG TPA: hypothetical protein GXZ31_03085 [Thermoanaerobacterales bacterium]|nr:hypothetical protein [Thermoanaerobacterales bacterium]
MWTVIYMTQNVKIAKQVYSLLTREGLMVKIDELDKLSDKNKLFYEILVLESEAEEAQVILLEHMNL